jgi:hypothetical protein
LEDTENGAQGVWDSDVQGSSESDAHVSQIQIGAAEDWKGLDVDTSDQNEVLSDGESDWDDGIDDMGKKSNEGVEVRDS